MDSEFKRISDNLGMIAPKKNIGYTLLQPPSSFTYNTTNIMGKLKTNVLPFLDHTKFYILGYIVIVLILSLLKPFFVVDATTGKTKWSKLFKWAILLYGLALLLYCMARDVASNKH